MLTLESIRDQLPEFSTHHGDISWYLYQPCDFLHPPHYSPEEISFFTEAIMGIDIMLGMNPEADLSNLSEELQQEVRGKLSFIDGFIRHFPERNSEFVIKRGAYYKNLFQTIWQTPETAWISLAHGALPEEIAFLDVYPLQEDQERMMSIVVGATEGAGRGKTHLLSQFPEKALQYASISLSDDCADTIISITSALEAVVAARLGTEIDTSLSDALVGSFTKGFEHYTGIYRAIVELAYEQHCNLAIMIYKNMEFLKVLNDFIVQKLTHNPTDRWALIQNRLLEHIIEIPGEWIMGFGPDTGKRGEKIVNELRKRSPELFAHPVASQWLSRFAQSKMRIGASTDTIIALRNKPGETTEFMTEALDEFIIEELDRKLRQYFHISTIV